jgi:hypothetical protein
MYSTLDRNRDMHCCPVEYTNSPHIIMQNDRMVSIQNTTQIDLQGQAASESDGHRHISGTGGQLQFVRGAYASKGGKTFICLSSTYDKRGDRRSRIVLDLTQGNIVTTPRSDIMYVVTEYGIVNLKGKSIAERAQALIGIAHPDFREGLERQAHEHRLFPAASRFRSCGSLDPPGKRTMTTSATTTEALLLVETDDGVATLTLNRPNQFNALSGALIGELQSALDRIAGDAPSASSCWRRAGAGSAPATTSRAARDGVRRRRRGALRPLQPHDDDHRAAAQARDRQGARPGHRRRLSARGHVRPGRGLLHRHLRDARREHRRLLLHARRGAGPRRRAQARHGHAAHRRAWWTPNARETSGSSIESCRRMRSTRK